MGDYFDMVESEGEKQPAGNKSKLNDGLYALVTKMRVLSDQFEEECCAEPEEFNRGQHDGKSLAYEACAEMVSDFLKTGM